MVQDKITNSIANLVFVTLDTEEEVSAAKTEIAYVRNFLKSTEKSIQNSTFLSTNEPIDISDDEDNNQSLVNPNNQRYVGNEIFSNLYPSRFDVLKDIDIAHLSNNLLWDEKTIDSTQIAFTRSGLAFTYQMIQTLQPNVWINTNVIDYMANLIYYRHLKKTNNNPTIIILHNYFFQEIFFKGNTYQFKKSKFKSIKSLDIMETLIIPVYHNSHFFLMTYSFKTYTIKYYDSLYNQSRGENFSSILLKYLIDLYKFYNQSVEEKDITIDVAKEGIPQQNNSVDCGVYTIMFIDFIIDNIDFDQFNSDHLLTLRQTILYSLVKDKLAY